VSFLPAEPAVLWEAIKLFTGRQITKREMNLVGIALDITSRDSIPTTTTVARRPLLLPVPDHSPSLSDSPLPRPNTSEAGSPSFGSGFGSWVSGAIAGAAAA